MTNCRFLIVLHPAEVSLPWCRLYRWTIWIFESFPGWFSMPIRDSKTELKKSGTIQRLPAAKPNIASDFQVEPKQSYIRGARSPCSSHDCSLEILALRHARSESICLDRGLVCGRSLVSWRRVQSSRNFAVRKWRLVPFRRACSPKKVGDQNKNGLILHSQNWISRQFRHKSLTLNNTRANAIGNSRSSGYRSSVWKYVRFLIASQSMGKSVSFFGSLYVTLCFLYSVKSASGLKYSEHCRFSASFGRM